MDFIMMVNQRIKDCVGKRVMDIGLGKIMERNPVRSINHQLENGCS